MIAQASVERLPLAENSVDMIFTDPPYERKDINTYRWLANESARVLKPGGFVLAMCGGAYMPLIYLLFGEVDTLKYFYQFEIRAGGRAPTVWRDGNEHRTPVIARSKPMIAYSKGNGCPRVGGMVNSFDQVEGASKVYHHWGQDVASARYYIDHFTKPGDLVLDPFIGGGTTKVACKLIGRRCVALDIDPAALRTTRARMETEEIPFQVGMFAQVPA